MPRRSASSPWPQTVWTALATHAIVLALLPSGAARGDLPLEDTLPHMEYAQLFDAFHSWSARNRRTYATSEDTRSAITAYYYNKKAVAACNAASERTGFSCGLGEFADETHAQFSETRLREYDKIVKRYSREGLHNLSFLPKAVVPSSVDWRTSGAVQPVRNQGKCGASYAFAAVAAVESLHAIMSGERLSLSEQMLISCSDGGCGADLPHNALGWVHSKGGVASLQTYPYLSANGSSPSCGCCGGSFGLCTAGQPECERATTCGGYFEVPSGDEKALMDAVAQQPVVSAIDASSQSFMLYSAGVYHNTNSKGGNHAILIVGYGSENGVDFWLFKNSWGSTWGEGGYGKLKRGSSSLGVGNWAVYPATPTYPIRCATPTDGDVRLSAMPRGIATIYEDGAWRAMCADDKDDLGNAASLVCKQLGYGGAAKAEGWKVLSPRTLVSGQRDCASTDLSILQCTRHSAVGCESVLGVVCAEPIPGTPTALHVDSFASLRVCGSAFIAGSPQPEPSASAAEGKPVLTPTGEADKNGGSRHHLHSSHGEGPPKEPKEPKVVRTPKAPKVPNDHHSRSHELDSESSTPVESTLHQLPLYFVASAALLPAVAALVVLARRMTRTPGRGPSGALGPERMW